ncbi:hypothetical protein HK102_007330 [Quaeritorhiza haematococci]|nr:hypothetical protein HK102_007330 [Quaeritorhiza haematococci]
MAMPAWYDIIALADMENRPEDETGMMETVSQLTQLIKSEIDAGIPADKIVLGGFSQGAAMSLLTGLTMETKIGAVIALSGYLPLRKKFNTLINPPAKSLPILMCHGEDDDVVAYAYGKRSADALKNEFGFTGLEFHSFKDLGHSSSPEELGEVAKFLKKVL